jgi:hypothetical protein
MQNRDEVTEALRKVIKILETDTFPFGPPTTDYDILMRACYGPLLTWNPETRRHEMAWKRQRPEGALEKARALTATVVELLGGESGATVSDVQVALKSLHSRPV